VAQFKTVPRSQRQYRVGEVLRHALAEILIRGDLRDPEIVGLSITVTEVEISPDLRNATVWFMPLGGDRGAPVETALARCAGYLRSQTARAVALRYVPSLEFRLDPSFDEADKIDRLLHDPAVARDLAREPDSSN